ncbi:MAG: response regulator transcription factor [Anaerolineae bacterium]|jgi:DNA-binding response OmpR family regulator
MPTILIVEDERNLCDLIRDNLQEQGYQVLQAFDGPSALTMARETVPDLVILDIMLPGMDGLEVCRRLRQGSIVPILMLTARAEEIDRVLGLELGADDYLTKPFSMRELKARVRALLRRVEMMQTTDVSADQVVTSAGLYLDPTSYETRLDDQAIDLTPKEFSLLYLLVRHPGRVFSRAYLLDEIWGYEAAAYDRTVDTHIYRLRQKLGTEGEIAQRIVAVRGIGYKFERG